MLGGRDWLVLAMVVVLVLEACCLSAIVAIATFFLPDEAQAVEFASKPKDRPVLESVQQVLQARTTGISEFDYNGVHYVIDNLPKEYVDYASWYVRMP